MISVFLALCLIIPAGAQTRNESPDFTITSIEESLESIEANGDLTEDQKKQSRALLEKASLALSDATKNKETEALYRAELENAQDTLQELSQEISKQQSLPQPEFLNSTEPLGEDALVKLEQDLIADESRASALRSELEGYQKGLQNLAARQIAAPDEIIEAREQLGALTVQITELGNGALDRVGEARRQNLMAQRYMQATKVAALEQEIAGLSERGEILTARLNLTELKLGAVEAVVNFLQDKTGMRRANEAAAVKSDALATLALYAESHPMVQEMARRNVALADSLIDLATDGTVISKRSANIRSRIDDVESDLRVARDFIALGDLDRQAGATLRRLSNQLQAPQAIKNQIELTQKTLVAVTQKRLIAQEALRNLPLGRPDITKALTLARIDDPDLLNLSVDDEASFTTLYSQQRELLLRVSSAASTRINEIVELQNQQKSLLDTTVELKDILDEKLIWISSVSAVDVNWPQKVFKGAFSLFSPKHTNLVAREFAFQSKALWPVIMILILLIMVILNVRRKIWADILRRGKLIGDVVGDSFWHTPMVILGCVIIALPLPILFLTLALLFATSSSPDPLIIDIRDTFLYLGVFSLFFLAWRAWDRDGSLFDSHFKFPKTIRSSLNKNFKWFIPFAGLSTAVVGFTEGSQTPEIYEGLSLFAFIISALALAVLTYLVIFTGHKNKENLAASDGNIRKYSPILAIIFIGIPLLTIFFASCGYYETSTKILWRLFISGWLFLLSYVISGLIRRTVLVAQRRLALRQARAKRDAAVRAREEKAAAEERGETLPLPPPIDASTIDIKAISRQSAQLLNTLIVIGFAGLIWWIWSDMLPALSIFNDVVIGSYTGQTFDPSGIMVDTKIPITLWNIIQGIAILGLTYIAAKNLPGFLEVFVLNRSRFDAGTRYAIRTVLGYIIVAIGVIIGFDRLGLQWSQLRWIVTGLSVGIGFGLQKIIANFVSGLIILFERPIRLGDYVTIGDQSGTVSRIQIRATTLSDLENREILIPNEALISERVTNWTLSNPVTRVTINIGIAYGSDTDAAAELMLDTLKTIPKVLELPPPQVLFTGFGDSSLDFELRAFLRNFDDRVPVESDIHSAIYKALEDAGITIPFPQRDLHVVSQVDAKPLGKKKEKPSK